MRRSELSVKHWISRSTSMVGNIAGCRSFFSSGVQRMSFHTLIENRVQARPSSSLARGLEEGGRAALLEPAVVCFRALKAP